jgi:hypothetical protein
MRNIPLGNDITEQTNAYMEITLLPDSEKNTAGGQLQRSSLKPGTLYPKWVRMYAVDVFCFWIRCSESNGL